MLAWAPAFFPVGADFVRALVWDGFAPAMAAGFAGVGFAGGRALVFGVGLVTGCRVALPDFGGFGAAVFLAGVGWLPVGFLADGLGMGFEAGLLVGLEACLVALALDAAGLAGLTAAGRVGLAARAAFLLLVAGLREAGAFFEDVALGLDFGEWRVWDDMRRVR